MSNEQCQAGPPPRVPLIARYRHSVKRFLFLYVWCRWFYRPTMRLLHRFDLHYAPPNPLSPAYGHRDHWCQWCGLRGTTYRWDPNDGQINKKL